MLRSERRDNNVSGVYSQARSKRNSEDKKRHFEVVTVVISIYITYVPYTPYRRYAFKYSLMNAKCESRLTSVCVCMKPDIC